MTNQTILNTWRNYLEERYTYFANSNWQPRSGSDFHWETVGGHKISTKQHVANLIKSVPPIYALFKGLTSKDADKTTLGWVDENIESLYEVRCLLYDDLSKHLFDEAIIMRLASSKRFFYPLTHFSELLSLVSEKPFEHNELPTTFLGIPLNQSKVVLQSGDCQTPLELITPKGTIGMLNTWSPYLINRGSIRFEPKTGDVVLDCGACIGDNAMLFAGLVGSSGEVHGFDPVPLHIRFCNLQAELNPTLSQILRFNALAVGKSSNRFKGNGAADCDEIQPGGLAIEEFEMTSLDDYVSASKLSSVDFIKMDVEGFEHDALTGAKDLIREFRPKLAISTYHSDDDFWSLPLRIKELNSNYKFLFGHHSPMHWESVIYAF